MDRWRLRDALVTGVEQVISFPPTDAITGTNDYWIAGETNDTTGATKKTAELIAGVYGHTNMGELKGGVKRRRRTHKRVQQVRFNLCDAGSQRQLSA